MIKNDYNQKSSNIDCKSDYYFMKEINNPYAYSLGKYSHVKFTTCDKMHRINNFEDKNRE